MEPVSCGAMKGFDAMSYKAWIAGLLLVVVTTGSLQADDSFRRNALIRSLGIGWSDGYHSKTGCPPKGCAPHDVMQRPSSMFQSPFVPGAGQIEQLPTPASRSRPSDPVPLKSSSSKR